MSRLDRLPSVHALAETPELVAAGARFGRARVVDAVREVLETARAAAREGAAVPGADALAADALARLARRARPRPARVINATGVVLHTNLGRAPVSAAAADAMRRAATGYSDLEYDLDDGRRGSRHDLLVPALRDLTGAEAALVVNNNAGATLLVLSALAAGREVVVSRGQLVEIGGGYRIPDVMAAGGAVLREVGTTNRTRIADYAAAIGQATALLMRVHTSNYRIVGFTEEAPLGALVGLGAEHDLPVLDDLGSGSLIDTTRFGLAPEPIVTDSIAAGAALVTFSGDKLLGGPQAGIVVGRADLVARLRAHPLARALRPGKATLAGLDATLEHYARGEAEEAIPIWRMLGARAEDLAARAERWRAALADGGPAAELAAGRSAIGGGALPGEALPTTLLCLPSDHPDALAAALRAAGRPVVARIQDGAVVLDPRTVLPEEDDALLDALRGAP